MTLVVGLPPAGPREPLTLAAMLARSSGEDVVLTTVTPRGFPDPRADREYRQWVADQVRTTQDDAAATLRAAGVDAVRTLGLEATSVPAGLGTAVQQERGSLLVLGPSGDAPAGRFTAGTVTDGLLHSSPVPLALAPRDCPSAERVTRLSCAWVGTERSREALAWTRRTAQAWQVPLRLVTFAPERAPMLPSETGLGIEGEVNAQWAEQARAELDSVVADWPEPTGTLVARGRGWAGAVAAGDWHPGDVLVVGSSRLGPLARVFLGSTAARIVRHAPIPVVLVPRGAGG
jgi:nucleotide-binding universal stress UspA family protein